MKPLSPTFAAQKTPSLWQTMQAVDAPWSPVVLENALCRILLGSTANDPSNSLMLCTAVAEFFMSWRPSSRRSRCRVWPTRRRRPQRRLSAPPPRRNGRPPLEETGFCFSFLGIKVG